MTSATILRSLRAALHGYPRWMTSDRDRRWVNTLERDEYVEHLLSVVGGWMAKGNLDGIDYSVKHMPHGGAVVEIGSFLGLSTTIIMYALFRNRPGTPFFSCDPFRFAGTDRPKSGYFDTGSAAYRDWVMDGFRRNLRMFCKDAEPASIEAFSDEFFRQWGERRVVQDVLGRDIMLGGPISFAYVDGSHTYESVARDLQNVDLFLLPGGYLFFDDSADHCDYVGVRRLMQELSRDSKYEPVMKTPNYCFRKRL